jgi:hypothetical protein
VSDILFDSVSSICVKVAILKFQDGGGGGGGGFCWQLLMFVV